MLSGTLIPSRDFLCSFPLGLEVDCLEVPFLDGGQYSIHGHNMSHERGGYFS